MSDEIIFMSGPPESPEHESLPKTDTAMVKKVKTNDLMKIPFPLSPPAHIWERESKFNVCGNHKSSQIDIFRTGTLNGNQRDD